MQIVFFSKNVSLNTKINLRLEKKHKKFFGGNFKNTYKNFCRRHQRNASHTISIYENCMTSVFFSENKNKKKSNFSVVAAQKML